MKKFLLFLLIPISASAAVLPFSFWKSKNPVAFEATCTSCTVTYEGDYNIYKFLASDTFVVKKNRHAATAEYLVIGGGGGGGNDIGGGGGAGRVRTATGYAIPVGSYTVTVGAGGDGGAANADGALNNGAKSGSSSTFDTITAEGGGYGCWYNSNGGAWAAAVAGGSGGGGCLTSTAGGAGSAISNAGGTGTGNIGAGSAGAGGGGCGGAGSNASSGNPGNGGPGCTYTISGASVCYAGGGAGGNHTGSTNTATATCGGGNGSRTGGVNGSPGTDGTGGGGGSSGGAGPSFYAGGKGGSGIVVLKVKARATPQLLVRFNETAGSTSMVDSSTYGRPLTNVSSGVVTASTSPLFSNNGNFGAGSQELTTPMDSNLSFGTGDFTVEGWFYYGSWGDGARGLITVGESSGNEDWSLEFSTTGGNNVRFTSSKHSFNYASSTGPTNNVWNHIAVTRSGTTLKIFLQGSQVYSGTDSTNYNVASSASLHLGRRPANANYFIGRMDEIRIVKGTALYTSAFTPPALPFK